MKILENHKVIFVFVDGVGLGGYNENNPLITAQMPFLRQLLGQALVKGIRIANEEVLCKGIDAKLGVDGIPQSATGQTSLFTGKNASKALGYHLPAFPNEELVVLIKEHSIFKRAKELELQATFANAYRPEYFKMVKEGQGHMSVTTHCVLAAEDEFRGIEDLRRGEALSWDMTNKEFQKNVDQRIEVIKPCLAGERLGELVQSYNLVVYETFVTDLVGHQKNKKKAEECLQEVDECIGGIVGSMPENSSVIVTSDHGNIEDLTTGGHTNNDVPLLVIGGLAQQFEEVESIDEVMEKILSNIKNKR